MKNIIISAKNLCKSYNTNGVENTVLHNVDLDIYEGDFTVVMGASGSGKSTLMYSLSAMDKPTSGQVIYKGNDISVFSENELSALRRNDFGFIFQQMHLVSNLTLRENVSVSGYISDYGKTADIDAKASELFAEMDLTEVADRLPSQCSGGEQQRAAIARAVISSPKLLFADEPTGALNKTNGRYVLDLLTGINQKGQSILMVTHDLRAALRANRLVYISDGKIDGEMTLPPYERETRKAREAQVNQWLDSLSW